MHEHSAFVCQMRGFIMTRITSSGKSSAPMLLIFYTLERGNSDSYIHYIHSYTEKLHYHANS